MRNAHKTTTWGVRSRIGSASLISLLIAFSLSLGLRREARCESLDAVDTASTESPDSIARASGIGPDEADRDSTHDSARAASAFAESPTEAREESEHSLDEVPVADSRPPDNTNLDWAPPPCGQRATPRIRYPDTSDPNAWLATLRITQQRIDAARSRLERATDAFEGALSRGFRMPATRSGYGSERDAARRAYSDVSCEMPVLLEAARRDGVEPSVLSSFAASASPEAGF